MHSVLAAAIAALLAFAAAKFQAAQPRFTEADLSGWAKQIESDAAVLRSRPALSDWRQRHAAERVELASYPALHSTDYEVDFLEQSRWCGVSVDRHSPVVRAALFFIPEADLKSPPQLPAAFDKSLTNSCQLQAIWYQTRGASAMDSLVNQLSAAWGNPNDVSAPPSVRGSGLWTNTVAWHRHGMGIWVAHDPGLPGTNASEFRTVVYVVRDRLAELGGRNLWLGSTPEAESQIVSAAGELAGKAPAFTREMLTSPRCEAGQRAPEDVDVTGRRLSRWLSDANTLPRVRRSAVLLLADVYVSRCQSCGSAALNLRLKELGARFESGCTPSDTNFSHNFRRQSERLNPEGPAGELAALLFLYDPCSLRGRVSWPELVIAKGQPILGQFGEDKWSPLMHYQLGRAYAAKLSFALPGGDPESGEKLPLNVVARRNTRNQAVTHFRAFLERDGLGGQRIAAWQEAWRLLAELPPSLINFGCGCE